MNFPRGSRLVSKLDFKFVFDKPRKISSQHLKILYRINALSQPRLGIIAAKSILRLAVDRNRVRRIIRESFRQHYADLGAVDVIVMLSKAVGKTEGKALREEIDEIWVRTSSLRKTSSLRRQGS